MLPVVTNQLRISYVVTNQLNAILHQMFEELKTETTTLKRDRQ